MTQEINTPQFDGDGNLISKPDAAPAAGLAPAPGSVVKSVADSLGAAASKPAESAQDVKSAQPQAFDLSSLTPEMLANLKQMLNATPDRIARKKENPIVKLRVMNEKIIVDYKNAYTGIVRDTELRADVERPLIPVLLEGESDFQTILYSLFMELPQVKCQVVSARKEEVDVPDGECISNITGRPTEMLVHIVKDFFTVKLPDGSTREFEGRIINA